MKTLLLLLLLVLAAALLSGCVSPASVEKTSASIQQVLDLVLPPDFTGAASFTTSINTTPAKISVRAGGLRRVNGRWHYDWLVWQREGFWSRGSVVIGSPSPAFLP